MHLPSSLLSEFSDRFGTPSSLFRAPGRVNLIGEHTDYNGGFVLPAALTQSTWIAAAPRSDRHIRIVSRAMPDAVEIDLDSPPPGTTHHWSSYVAGVALLLEQSGHRLRGADMLIDSEVPVGSGLSSSAALELAAGCALVSLSGVAIDRLDLVRICQRAENEYVGMRCGIMDQFIGGFGQAGKALLLDCRSLEYRLLPVPEDLKIVVCNTMVKHALASGEYNLRRQQCEEGVRILAAHIPGVKSLRDVTPADVTRFASELPPVVERRARHIVTENKRTQQFAEALTAGSLAEAGKLMGESHRSLQHDFEVSCEELDLMVDLAAQSKLCIGARMTGGGFGGCTVNLVPLEDTDRFAAFMRDGYRNLTGIEPSIYITTPGDGCGEFAVEKS